MFWKVLFFAYLSYLMLLTSTQAGEVAQGDISSTFYEIFGLTYITFGVILALVYFYALGWKKQLIGSLCNRYLLCVGIILTVIFAGFFCMQGSEYLHNDMLVYAMREGMVPRNPDFQALLWITRAEILLYGLIRVFLIFVPFYFGYYFYNKRMNNFEPMKYSGRKIFAVFMLLDGLPLIFMAILAFVQDFVKYNAFDVLSLLCQIYLLAGVGGYAFGRKFWSQNFWRITLPLFTVISFMPISLNSGSFQKLTQMPTLQTEPILFITNIVISIGALYLIYKYACTDEVYGNKEISI